MTNLHCPHCEAVHKPIAANLPDGVYTEICTTCLEAFSYRVEDGEVVLSDDE